MQATSQLSSSTNHLESNSREENQTCVPCYFFFLNLNLLFLLHLSTFLDFIQFTEMNAPDQLCYIPCKFCTTVLGVSVPSSSLFDVVTVRCGHCTNLWSVNMAATFQSQSQHVAVNVQAPNNPGKQFKVHELGSSSKWNNNKMMNKPEPRIVNRPPEKRQRVPSAYNQFIKQEIQRIKANNPDISHREAFSAAAKNWAHFPHIHFGLMLETNKRA